MQNILGFVNPGPSVHWDKSARRYKRIQNRHANTALLVLREHVYPPLYVRMRIFMRFPAFAYDCINHSTVTFLPRHGCIKHRDTRMFLRSSISKHICSSRERYLPPLYKLYIRISYIRARDLRECILRYISKRTFFRESEREESFKKHLISYRVIKDMRYFGRDDRKMAFTANEFYLELSIDVSVASSRLLSIISRVSHDRERRELPKELWSVREPFIFLM